MSNINNPEYWQDRAERLILAGEKSADEMTDGLKKVYEEYYRKIMRDIESFYGRYTADAGISISDAMRKLNRSELKSYYEQLQEYYDAIEKSRYEFDPAYKSRLSRELSIKAAISRLEALKADVQWHIENLYAREQDAFKAGLSEVYEDSFYRSTFNLQQGLGFVFDFSVLSAVMISKSVNRKWADNNYKNRIWENKDRLTLSIDKFLSFNILNSQPVSRIKALLNDIFFGKGEAKGRGGSFGHHIRTSGLEFNHIMNEAIADSYEQSEFVEQYKFIAIIDARTTESCNRLNDRIFNLSDRQDGINYPPILFPPHPCRSTTMPYFNDRKIDLINEFRARYSGKYRKPEYLVSENMKYSDWKKERGIA